MTQLSTHFKTIPTAFQGMEFIKILLEAFGYCISFLIKWQLKRSLSSRDGSEQSPEAEWV